jgi:hypothetical protein
MIGKSSASISFKTAGALVGAIRYLETLGPETFLRC